MYEDQFKSRLVELRAKKGVSARDMSLSIGQNPGYINNIENGKALPSMAAFFYICDYLQISPKEFFDFDAADPALLQELMENIKRLDEEQQKTIAALVKGMK